VRRIRKSGLLDQVMCRGESSKEGESYYIELLEGKPCSMLKKKLCRGSAFLVYGGGGE